MELIIVVAILAVILGIFIGWMTVGIQLGIQKHKYLNSTTIFLEEIETLKKDRDKLIRYAEYLAVNLDSSITYIEYIATHFNTTTKDVYEKLNKAPEFRKYESFKDFFDY